MKKMVLFFLLIITLICSSVACTSNKNTLSATDTEIEVDAELQETKYTNTTYDKDGVKVEFGVLGGQNMFEPNSEIKFFATIKGKSLDNTEAKVSFMSSDLTINEEKTFMLDQPFFKARTYTGSFSASRNDIYTLTLRLDGNICLKFNVGVVPKTEMASDNFYYGVQPYIVRTYTWGKDYAVAYQDADKSITSILNSIEWLGCNTIRDSVLWEAMQPFEKFKINFDLADSFISSVQDRGIKLNWILSATPRWAIKEDYLATTPENMFWSICPEEEKWDKYVTALAEKYADNKNIFWEVWNEPDWEFFSGKPEDYISLLERTAKIFRTKNPDVMLYPGGLTVTFDPNDSRHKDSAPYFEGYRRLLDEKLINTYSIHLHGHFDGSEFFLPLNEIKNRAEEAGLSMSGIFNTEAGLFEPNEDAQAQNLMDKILYTRGHDYKMYVQYSFRSSPAEPNDAWSIFNSSLQPKKAAIAYATLIRMLGQTEKIDTICDFSYLFADIYFDGKNSIVPVYNDGSYNEVLTLPEGKEFKAYDMYGNPIDIVDNAVKVTLSPVYIIFDGKVTPDMFKY